MSIAYQLAQFTVRSRATGTVVAGAEVRVYADVDGTKGALSTQVFDIDGNAINQTSAPMETDVEGVVRFRHAPGVWFIEATDGSNIFQRPGFPIGTAAQHDTGNGATDVPANSGLGAAIVANVERGDLFQALTGITKTEDQSGKILGVQYVGGESVINVYPILAFLPSDAGNAGKVLRLNPSNSKLLEWAGILDLLPDGTGEAGKVLTLNVTEDGLEWTTPAGGGTDLPDMTGNAGKHLAVNGTEDGAEWVDPPSAGDALPDFTGNAGKALFVNTGEDAAEWADIPSELPAIGGGDAGKVLTVNGTEDGYIWETPSGGGAGGPYTVDGSTWASGTRMAAASDHDTIIDPASASALTLQLPDEATVSIPVGTLFTVVRRGTGTLTVEVAASATINGATDSYAIDGQFGAVTIYKRAANDWIVTGQASVV